MVYPNTWMTPDLRYSLGCFGCIPVPWIVYHDLFIYWFVHSYWLGPPNKNNLVIFMCVLCLHHGKDNDMRYTYSKNKAKDTQGMSSFGSNFVRRRRWWFAGRTVPLKLGKALMEHVGQEVFFFLNVYISCNNDMNWRVGIYIYIMNMYPVYDSTW